MIGEVESGRRGYSIWIVLPDGIASRLRLVEKTNWTGLGDFDLILGRRVHTEHRPVGVWSGSKEEDFGSAIIRCHRFNGINSSQ